MVRKNNNSNSLEMLEELGQRLHTIRTSRGLTLQEVAEGAGFSASFLSMLENGKTGISFSNLQKLLRFYNLTIGDLWRPELSSDGRVVRLSQAQVVTRAEGVDAVLLVNGTAGKKIAPYLFYVQPGASIGFMEHEGEEFAHVLRGSFEVVLRHPETAEEEIYILNEGDTIYYPSTLQHKYTNLSSKTSVFLAAVTPPTF